MVTTSNPTQETTSPTQETTSPTQETASPTQETTSPTQETTSPTEETSKATQCTNAPEQGRVKWFNAQSGYGFIADTNADLFVHHSALKTKDDQFRYLVEGEYVEFSTETMDDGRTTAVSVTGIRGGPLMCETRQQRRDADQERGGNRGRERRPARTGGGGGGGRGDDQMLWQVVQGQLESGA